MMMTREEVRDKLLQRIRQQKVVAKTVLWDGNNHLFYTTLRPRTLQIFVLSSGPAAEVPKEASSGSQAAQPTKARGTMEFRMRAKLIGFKTDGPPPTIALINGFLVAGENCEKTR